MAPELVEREVKATTSTDLYSVGITAYELLLGKEAPLPHNVSNIELNKVFIILICIY